MQAEPLAGDVPLDVLLKFKDTGEPYVAQNLTTVLGVVGDERSVDALLDMAVSGAPATRERAVGELAQLAQGDRVASTVSASLRRALLRADRPQRDALAVVVAAVRTRNGRLRRGNAALRDRLKTVDLGLYGGVRLWMSVAASLVVFALVAVALRLDMEVGLGRTLYVAGAALAAVVGVAVALTSLRKTPLNGSYDPPLALGVDMAATGIVALAGGLVLGGAAISLREPASAAAIATAEAATIAIAVFVTWLLAEVTVHLVAALLPTPSMRGLGIAVQTSASAAAGVLVLHLGTVATRDWLSRSVAFREGIVPQLVEAAFFLGIPFVCSLAVVLSSSNGGRALVTHGTGWRALKLGLGAWVLLAAFAEAALGGDPLPAGRIDPARLTLQSGRIVDSKQWLTIESDRAQDVLVRVPAEVDDYEDVVFPRRMDYTLALYGWPSLGAVADRPTCGERPADLEGTLALAASDDPPRLEARIGWGCYAILISDIFTREEASWRAGLRRLVARHRPDYQARATWETTLSNPRPISIGDTGRLSGPGVLRLGAGEKRKMTVGESMLFQISSIPEGSGFALAGSGGGGIGLDAGYDDEELFGELGPQPQSNAGVTASIERSGKPQQLGFGWNELSAGDQIFLQNETEFSSLVEIATRRGRRLEWHLAEPGDVALAIEERTWLTAKLQAYTEDLVLELFDAEDNVVARGDDPEELTVPDLGPGRYRLAVSRYLDPGLADSFAQPLLLEAVTSPLD